MRFSPSTLGWYPEHTHYPNLPADTITVDDDLYRALIGHQIEVGPDGLPRKRTPQPPSAEQVQASLLAAVDARLNAAAQDKGYDSIITAALRAALPDSPFHDEGVAFGTWMDQTYAACYAVLAEVQAGAAIPTEAELMALLPPAPEF